jgi:hypothetical protein
MGDCGATSSEGLTETIVQRLAASYAEAYVELYQSAEWCDWYARGRARTRWRVGSPPVGGAAAREAKSIPDGRQSTKEPKFQPAGINNYNIAHSISAECRLDHLSREAPSMAPRARGALAGLKWPGLPFQPLVCSLADDIELRLKNRLHLLMHTCQLLDILPGHHAMRQSQPSSGAACH